MIERYFLLLSPTTPSALAVTFPIPLPGSTDAAQSTARIYTILHLTRLQLELMPE